VYHFVWSDFADWYIEQIKPRLYGDQPGGDVARAVAARTFEVALMVLHPIMPFITETLWRRYPGRDANASISVTPWPRPDKRAENQAAERDFGRVQEYIVAVRQIRAEYGIEPGKSVRAGVIDRAFVGASPFWTEWETVRRLAKVSSKTPLVSGDDYGASANAVLSDGTDVFVPLGDVLDLEKERSRLGGEIARLDTLIRGQEGKLANEQFTSRAPQEIVSKEREKLANWRQQRALLAEKRDRLG
jgi:valyl-tRNA synthetase